MQSFRVRLFKIKTSFQNKMRNILWNFHETHRAFEGKTHSENYQAFGCKTHSGILMKKIEFLTNISVSISSEKYRYFKRKMQ